MLDGFVFSDIFLPEYPLPPVTGRVQVDDDVTTIGSFKVIDEWPNSFSK